MPRPKKKDPKEWTTEEAMERLFPKPVREKAKKVVREAGKPQVRGVDPSIKDQTT